MLEVAICKKLPQFELDVSFTAGNEVMAIFGPSGSGKSLTLQCVAGLVKPDSGRIAINAQPVYDSATGLSLRPRDRRVGYVFQSYALFPHMTVLENIGYGLDQLAREERNQRVKRMVDLMRLDGLGKRRPDELSGGQQQRVALARALVTEPDLLLLDEPFSALDSPIRSRLHGELLHILKSLPITAVLVTHNLSEAYTLSRTMVVFDAGRVLQIGPRDEVLHRPASRAVARFTTTKNIFRGQVVGRDSDHLELRAGNLLVHAKAGPYQLGEKLDFCIRPEEVMLLRPERALGDPVEENLYPAEIVEEIAQGTSFTLQMKLVDDPLGSRRDFDIHVDLPANVYYRLGLDTRKQWVVSLKKQAIHVIGLAAPSAPALNP